MKKRKKKGETGRERERGRGQKEPSEIKNGHGDEGRHFIILLEIIRVYFFSVHPLRVFSFSILPPVLCSRIFDCTRIIRAFMH